MAVNNEDNLYDSELMVVYCPCDNEHTIFVMNEDQFYNEFEEV